MSKFKVGDRVRVKDHPEYGDLIITECGERDSLWVSCSLGVVGGFTNDEFEIVVTTPPIPAPIAERMRGLIERMAAAWPDDAPFTMVEEARAIMAELVPVDPDVLEARKIEAQICREADNEPDAARVEKGEFDDRPGMKGVLAAIKLGRELEREGRK